MGRGMRAVSIKNGGRKWAETKFIYLAANQTRGRTTHTYIAVDCSTSTVALLYARQALVLAHVNALIPSSLVLSVQQACMHFSALHACYYL